MEDKILELLQVMNAKLDKNSSDIEDMKYEMATMNSKITRLEEGQKAIKLTVGSIKCKVD